MSAHAMSLDEVTLKEIKTAKRGGREMEQLTGPIDVNCGLLADQSRLGENLERNQSMLAQALLRHWQVPQNANAYLRGPFYTLPVSEGFDLHAHVVFYKKEG